MPKSKKKSLLFYEMYRAGVSAGPPAILISDTFTDVDSTALSSHTPDVDWIGGGWSYAQGSLFTITGNELIVAQELNKAIIDSGVTDVKITGHVAHAQEEGFAFILRWVDDQNYIVGYYAHQANGQLYVREFVAGAGNWVAQLETLDDGAQSIDCEVTAVGSTITIKDLTNGTEISGECNPALLTGTIVGFNNISAESSTLTVDNFLVEPL